MEALDGWSSKYEITNAQYLLFRPRHISGQFRGRSLSRAQQPVVNVPYEDGMNGAVPFCRWLNERLRAMGRLPDGYEVRLPTEQEWIALARCGTDWSYPWGPTWPPTSGNYADESARLLFGEDALIPNYRDGFEVACEVEFSGSNAWGLYGMGGNVWEWTYDDKEFGHAIRGGSWIDRDPLFMRTEGGYVIPRSYRFEALGFRVVLMPVKE